MERLFKAFYILICFTVNTPFVSAGEIDNVINIESESVFPINYRPSPDSPIQGVAYDLVKALMDESHLQYNMEVYPWSRAYNNALTTQNVMIYPIGRTVEREEKLNWIGKIVTMTYNIYCLNNSLSSASLSQAIIKEKIIGIPRNGLRATHLKNLNFKNLLLTNGNQHTHKLLVHGRIDCLVASKWGIDRLKNEYYIKEGTLIKYDQFNIPETDIYIAISLKTNPKIVNKLKESYRTIVSNGTYISLIQPLIDTLK